MGIKFTRGLVYPNPQATGMGIAWVFKWAYEFWGYCVNGTSSLTVPGGFASNNGINFGTNFINGTSLLTSGTDGYHPIVDGNLFSGDCIFTAQSSTPFTAAMVGMALVIWKPNSNSSEDSIYLITKVISSSQILININTGGTPNATTKHPSMTQRSSVNYRVVDMVNATNNGYENGNYLVFQTDAGSINSGQASSQFQFTHLGTTADATAGITLGGSGSWDGTPYTITGATNAAPIVITTSANNNFVTGQTVSIKNVAGNTAANGLWVITAIGANSFSLTTSSGNGTYTSGGTVYNGFQNDGYAAAYAVGITTGQGYSSGQTAVTLIADKTFFICSVVEQNLFQINRKFNFHFEIPTRLYPQNQDLHPIVMMTQTANTGALTTTSSTASYGGGFIMRTHYSDTITARSYATLVKALRGDGLPDVFGQNFSNYSYGYNTVAGTIPMSDAILCLPDVAYQFSLGRVRLRSVKFTGTHVPPYHRMGLNGEFIQLQNGICWPWDNTIIPFQLLPFGPI